MIRNSHSPVFCGAVAVDGKKSAVPRFSITPDDDIIVRQNAVIFSYC